MKVSTSRFGEVECKAEATLTFASGIIGFPKATQYVLLDHDREAPFKWLQSVHDGGLAFVVMDPALFRPDYRVTVHPEEQAELGVVEGDALDVFVILTIPSGDPSRITANLQGPVVVNRRTRLAKQVILREESTTRYPLFPGEPKQTPVDEPVSLAACRD